jgi:Cu(I)/Ag(I) efflux system membrane fusion protein
MILGIAVIGAILACYGLLTRHPLSASSKRSVLYYVDPMHPAYKSDKPGIAPDCGMALVPVYAGEGASKAAALPLAQSSPGAVTIDGATRRLLGIGVASVAKSSATRVIRAVGRVTPEDTRVYRIDSGVDGFIRDTSNDSVGMPVKKDQKLASYYAPDFLAVASGFLAASERVPGAANGDGSRTLAYPGAVSKQGFSSLQGYADRLRNLGMSDSQIKRMAESRQLPESIDIVSPADGFILARYISPGQHFMHSSDFYRIADLSQVWVIAELFGQESQYLRPKEMAQVALRDTGRKLPARVSESLPQSEAGGGTVKYRLEVDNPDFVLRPDMVVDVELPLRMPAAVTVPADAVIDSGASARVYVEHGEGVFEPRQIQTGWRSGERVEILHGLQPGERVITAATFLVDSESRLRRAGTETAPAMAPAAGATTQPAAGSPAVPAPRAMPEHHHDMAATGGGTRDQAGGKMADRRGGGDD